MDPTNYRAQYYAAEERYERRPTARNHRLLQKALVAFLRSIDMLDFDGNQPGEPPDPHSERGRDDGRDGADPHPQQT